MKNKKRHLMLALQENILKESHRTDIQSQARKGAACICLAKDEAPYIHEYIHHYLYFGISHIHILVNRTTDSTTQILDQITARYPCVSYANCDWVDDIGMGEFIQLIGLACGIAYIRKCTDTRYAVITDIDEFWFPIDFQTSIPNYLDSLGNPAQVSFCWIQQWIREPPFTPPFDVSLGTHSNIIKSFVDISLPIMNIYAHRASLPPKYLHTNANGLKFVNVDQKPLMSAGSLHGHRAYILHRLQRSEEEYLASLLRGRPGKPGAIKDNRVGYKEMPSPTSPSLSMPLIAGYHESLNSFIKSCGISELITEARTARLKKSTQINSAISLMTSDSDRQILAKVLKGTAYQKLLQ